MLSYRHAFHAGNHADILKHFVLHEVLSYMRQKDKGYWYIDTHAGAGYYALDSGFASQNREFDGGITRLWELYKETDGAALPAPLRPLLQLVRSLNPDGVLRCYPGSAGIAHALLRSEDRLHLCELHPAELAEHHGDGIGSLSTSEPALVARA